MPSMRRLEFVRQDLPDPVDWLRLGAYPPSWSMDGHRHEHTQVILVMDGTGRHGIAGDVPIRAGDLLVVPAGTAHHWTATGGRWLRLLDLCVGTGDEAGRSLAARAAAAVPHDGRLRGGGVARLRPLATALIKVADETDPGAAWRLHGLAMQVLGEVQLLLGSVGGDDVDDLVAAVRDHLVNHYTDALDLDALAAVVHVTGKHLCRLFASAGLPSPMKLLESTRMVAAVDLLCNGDADITDIARQVGHADVRRFSRAFARVHGCTPGEFRRRHL